uniref:DNA-directed DNA polymerase n=1 Tax=Strongyloides papillosus TaxID=174720 RepID=A0A0N5C9M2_STREA
MERLDKKNRGSDKTKPLVHFMDPGDKEPSAMSVESFFQANYAVIRSVFPNVEERESYREELKDNFQNLLIRLLYNSLYGTLKMPSHHCQDRDYLYMIQLELSAVLDRAEKARKPIENGIQSHYALIGEMKETIQLGFERKIAEYIHKLHCKLGYDESHGINIVQDYFFHHYKIGEEQFKEMVWRNFNNFINQQKYRDLFTIAGTQMKFNEIPKKKRTGPRGNGKKRKKKMA